MALFNVPSNGFSETVFSDHEIRCMFIVRKVYGAALIGDMIPYAGGPAPARQNLLITREEIVKSLRPAFTEHPIIRDLTDYFLRGDQFGVKWHRYEGKIVHMGINFQGLYDRRGTSVSVAKIGSRAFGYVVNETPMGLLIWAKTKKADGALVFAPKMAICAEELRDGGIDARRSNLQFQAVSILMENANFNEEGPEYTIISHECLSLHSIAEKTRNAYFPTLSVDGVMVTILGDKEGAILDARSCLTTTTASNPNRAALKPGDKVYCPPWAFIMEPNRQIPLRWQEYCRLGSQYRCIVVFVKERGPAFDCSWIALGVKISGDWRSSQFINDHPKQPYLAAYEKYQRKQSMLSDWDPDEARKRIERQIIFGNAGGDGANGSDAAANCRILVEFWKKRQRQQAVANNDGGGPSDSISAPARASASGGYAASNGIGARRRRFAESRGTQTTVDNGFFQESRLAVNEMATLLEPTKLEEFYARFSSVQRMFK